MAYNLLNLKLLAPIVILLSFSVAACSNNDIATVIPRSTSTPIPEIVFTPTPTPTATPEAVPGTSRKKPLPVGQSVQQESLKITVEQVLRGNEAWGMIQEANPFNVPPASGQEYLLLKIHVENVGTGDDISEVEAYHFGVTGDRLQKYSLPGIVSPDPQLGGGLFPGGELTGWLVFSIAEGEHNLQLILSGSFNADTPTQYLALEKDAAISTDPLLNTLSITKNGLTRTSPADIGELVRTQDWEITTNTVLRGDKAWEKLLEANQFNDPPANGIEYLLVSITARYIGAEEPGGGLIGGMFTTTGGNNIIYDTPSAVEPEPNMDVTLFPGGTATGWLALQIGKNEGNRLLIFEPYLGNDRRFIKLSE